MFLLKWEVIVNEKMEKIIFILKLNKKQWSDSSVSFVPG